MAKTHLPTGIYGFTPCSAADLLKDYGVLHVRIRALYKMLEIHKYIHWYWYDSAHIKKKNYWNTYYDIVKTTINDKLLGLIKCKEDMENISIRNNRIHDIKNEIKRYHRMQSNIQNVLNDICIGGKEKILYRKLESRSPSQFKNGMYYTYYTQSILNEI